VTQDIVARRGSTLWNLKCMHELAYERYTIRYGPQDGISPKGHHVLVLVVASCLSSGHWRIQDDINGEGGLIHKDVD
jgi:hypothetical protein